MPFTDLDELTRRYFDQLLQQLGEDRTQPISMFAVGDALGLDRDASTATAEDLMAAGLVEVRTLAGDIGLSPAGLALQEEENGKASGGEDARLGEGSPLDARQRQLVEEVLTTLKAEVGASGLDYETLAEVMADLHTMQAQMISPRPKTTVIRACLGGIRDAAGAHKLADWQKRLTRLLG